MTDIRLDDADGSFVTVDSRVLKSTASDFLLENPARRKANTRAIRRALVHDQNDGLTINYNSDYPGGVTINDVVSIRNRRVGISLDGVKEISASSVLSSAGGQGKSGSSSADANTIMVRGNIMFEESPDSQGSPVLSLQSVLNLTQDLFV